MNGARRVLVTGGSRGLGAGIVQMFLDEGDQVATCSRSPTDQTATWSETFPGRFFHWSVDMTDGDSCEAFVREALDQLNGIDILLNNAGVARDGVLGLLGDADIETVIALNLKATLTVTRLVSRRMLRQGSGRIINISSVVGLRGYNGLSVYSATKAGLDGFTRALARELGPRGITVNSIAPGYLRTEMSHGLDASQLRQIERRTPAGRLGEPADVAAAARFLSSPEAGFITGHVLVVDGGLTA